MRTDLWTEHRERGKSSVIRLRALLVSCRPSQRVTADCQTNASAMKVVVTGASGLLGRAVCAGLKADGHTVLGTAHSRATPDSGLAKLDLTDFDGLEAYLRQQAPDAIVHTAAERRPDVVERSPEASHVLNVDVPSRIAAWCKAQAEPGPLLINISTDYVFDGVSPPYSVDDPPNPLNAYGKSKWEGEKGVRDDGRPGRTTNLRVPVLYVEAEVCRPERETCVIDSCFLVQLWPNNV